MKSDLSWENVLLAIIGGFASAIASAIVTRLLLTYWWLWVAVGVIVAFFIFVIFHLLNSNAVIYGSKVAIQTYDESYISVDDDQNSGLVGKKCNFEAEQIFEIHPGKGQKRRKVVFYGDKIAFKAIHNDRYVIVNLWTGGEKELASWSRKIEEWETFTLEYPIKTPFRLRNVVKYDNPIALFAYNKRYIRYTYIEDVGNLIAEAAIIRPEETFTLVNPNSPK